jgi:hypothetical protein
VGNCSVEEARLRILRKRCTVPDGGRRGLHSATGSGCTERDDALMWGQAAIRWRLAQSGARTAEQFPLKVPYVCIALQGNVRQSANLDAVDDREKFVALIPECSADRVQQGSNDEKQEYVAHHDEIFFHVGPFCELCWRLAESSGGTFPAPMWISRTAVIVGCRPGRGQR